MKIYVPVVFTVLAMVGAANAPLVAQDRSLDDVYRGMDTMSAEFSDMSADIERETHTLFINHSSFESGQMYFLQRRGDSRIRISITDPAPKEVLIGDGTAQRYNPRTTVLEEFGLGEFADKVEFLVLGFGTSSQDLIDQYEVVLLGEETLEGSVVSVLALTPRDPAMARNFPQIQLWMDQARWVPVETRLEQPSGDYQIARFSNVVLNMGLGNSAFELDLPDDVEIIRH